MDADFCVAALEEAINRYGVPEIFSIRLAGSRATNSRERSERPERASQWMGLLDG